jgi:MFS family permease
MLLIISIAAYLFAAIAHVVGKRPVFLFAMATLVAADAWAASSNTYNSLLGARMFSGIGQGAFECLALSNIPDLYFVHQRSTRIALFWIFLQTGVYLGVPIVTQIITRWNWERSFAGLAATEGITLILLFLFFHEPAYRREHIDPLANMSEEAVLEKVHDADVTQVEVEGGATAAATTEVEKPKTFLQLLKPYNGRFSQNNIFVLLYRSFILTFHPTIFWAATAGLLTAWPVGCSFTIAAFMTQPPYNMSPDAIANMYIAPWLGGLIALIVADPLFNWLTKYLTRRNNNVYEPEFRLYGTIPGIIMFCLGTVGWGWGSQVGIGWGGIAVFFGFILAGAVVYNLAVIGYIIDAHREWANESQVILFVAKVPPTFRPFLTVEYFPLWDGVLFCSLVGIGGSEDGVGDCCWYCGRSCFDWNPRLHFREMYACVLESSSLSLYS